MVGPDRDYEIRLIPDIFDPPPVAMDLEKNRFIERLHPKVWLNAAREHQYAAEIIFKHERQDRFIRSKERFMARQNGGHITRGEQRLLNRQENAVSREIGH